MPDRSGAGLFASAKNCRTFCWKCDRRIGTVGPVSSTGANEMPDRPTRAGRFPRAKKTCHVLLERGTVRAAQSALFRQQEPMTC
jgi:hypothetical protein